MKRLLLSIKLALRNLHNNKGRTILTLVGIVIGIMSVIVVMSSGQGVKDFVLGQFSTYGADEISIKIKVPSISKTSTANATSMAQGVQITTLKMTDVKNILKIPNVSEAVAATIGQELVSYKGQNKRTMLYGIGAGGPAVDNGIKIAEGEFYTQADDDSLSQVVVIGPTLATDLFAQEDPLGKFIKIKDANFKVVGILQPRGGAGVFNYDELAYVPEQTLQKKILGVDYEQAILAKVKDVNLVDVTALDITDTLRRGHHITSPDQDDFSVTTIQEAQKMIEDVFGTITILLLALTSISLVVGGVGIMNVMYVAVVERTFEIGLRKAVGAKSADILKQFLFEAIVITLIGGVVGIVLGFAISIGFSYILSALGFSLQFSVTANSVLVAVGFSTTTGIIFGYYPAWKASKLSPMEALRKE